MKKISLKIRDSNWETVAFLIIYEFSRTTGKHFSRSELMKPGNIDKAVKWLQHLNHKNFPTHPEETFQKTIQNLRDKGFIIFHGQGEYELTKLGIEECRRVANELNVQVSSMDETVKMVKANYEAETMEKVKEILEGMSPDEISELLKRAKHTET
jgi:hypothetical protein